MKRHLFTFGRTLARRMPHEVAYGAICTAIQHGRVRGHINIAVVRNEHPDQFDVEATFDQLSPEQALDAIAIAAARFGVLHKVRASTAVPIASDEAAALRILAERLVDRHRALGWWERICGVTKWIASDATFRHDREACVRELMHEIAAWRERETAQKDAA